MAVGHNIIYIHCNLLISIYENNWFVHIKNFPQEFVTVILFSAMTRLRSSKNGSLAGSAFRRATLRFLLQVFQLSDPSASEFESAITYFLLAGFGLPVRVQPCISIVRNSDAYRLKIVLGRITRSAEVVLLQPAQSATPAHCFHLALLTRRWCLTRVRHQALLFFLIWTPS